MKKDCKLTEHSTPAGVDCYLHYKKLGIDDAWNYTDRVHRLCRLLRISQYELADILRIPHDEMAGYLKEQVFPPTIVLWFALLEHVFVNIDNTEKEPLLPWGLFKK